MTVTLRYDRNFRWSFEGNMFNAHISHATLYLNLTVWQTNKACGISFLDRIAKSEPRDEMLHGERYFTAFGVGVILNNVYLSMSHYWGDLMKIPAKEIYPSILLGYDHLGQRLLVRDGATFVLHPTHPTEKVIKWALLKDVFVSCRPLALSLELTKVRKS